MATSLTNNVLTFDHGSIADVRNDLGACLPISISQSATFTWSSASSNNVTVSGSPGQVVIAAARANPGVRINISSNGGTWVYAEKGAINATSPNSLRATVSLNYLPSSTARWGSISGVGAGQNEDYYLVGIIAYRLY